MNTALTSFTFQPPDTIIHHAHKQAGLFEGVWCSSTCINKSNGSKTSSEKISFISPSYNLWTLNTIKIKLEVNLRKNVQTGIPEIVLILPACLFHKIDSVLNAFTLQLHWDVFFEGHEKSKEELGWNVPVSIVWRIKKLTQQTPFQLLNTHAFIIVSLPKATTLTWKVNAKRLYLLLNLIYSTLSLSPLEYITTSLSLPNII